MRKSLVAAVLTASTLLLASCAMPADDPNYNSGGGDQLDSADASAAADAQQGLESLLAPPTSIGVDTPLTAAPKKGATIVNLTNGTEYEKVFDTSLEEAASVLGWKVETVVVDPADPAAAATAFDAAVKKSPAGIHITGGMVDGLTASLPAAQSAGIPIVCTGCSGDPANGITDTSIDGTAQNTAWGNAMATYVVANQYDGEDAGVQYFSLPGGAFSDFNQAFNDTLTSQCRNCSATESAVDPTTVTLTDPDSVLSFVSSEMSTALGSWALFDSGALSTGVADALANDPTLLAPVVVIGRGAAASDIAALQALNGAGPALDGTSTDGGASPGAEASASPSAAPSAEASAADSAAASSAAAEESADGGRTAEQAAALQAWIGISQPVMAWRVIDQFARIIEGSDLATGDLPAQLLTGDNVSSAVLDKAGDYLGVADYQDQFKKLWGVS